MASMTIRELRQRWPAVERALETEEEIVITREGKAVAKISKFTEPQPVRKRFDPKRHLAEIRKILGAVPLPRIDARLAKSRADRTSS